MSTRSNFAPHPPLTDAADRLRIAAFLLALGLAISIAFIVLRLASMPSAVSELRPAPAAGFAAAGAEARR